MDELRRAELVSYAAVDELAMFLRTSGSTLCLSEAITRAVKFWMAAQIEGVAPARGYRWKTLFLPAGTRVRMSYDSDVFYANIVDDEFKFNGHATSPRGMTVAVAGPGRNAWRDLWVRRPGEREWAQADKLEAGGKGGGTCGGAGRCSAAFAGRGDTASIQKYERSAANRPAAGRPKPHES